MLEIFRSFFTAYWYVIIPVVFTVLLSIPVIVYWSSFKYWLMKVRIRLPVFGRIRHWVKHPGEKEKPSENNTRPIGFLSSERELCSFYDKYYRDHQPSEANFRRCQNYLGKVQEADRREKGLGLWALIIVLMLIEATAFGFALAPFALTLATPNTALAGAFAIGLVISIIGLFLSEFAGRALYKNHMVDNIMSYENLRRNGSGGDMISTHIITIDNTNDDDGDAPYQQLLNRMKVNKNGDMPAKRYTMLIGYGIFIVGLAVAAFWVRTETLNAQESDLIANPPAQVQSADDFPAADGVPIPDDMQALSDSAAGKSAQDQIDALHRASLVTFAVLSGLFIFIQASSTYLAFIFGFAGTHSRKAWERTHKFSSADDFMRYHASKARDVANDAQASLGMLQGLQMKVFRVGGNDLDALRSDLLNRTFESYIAQEDNKARGKKSRDVIETYFKKLMADLSAAIEAGDNAKINELISVATPRFNQIDTNDPTLADFKTQFASLSIFHTKPTAAPAPTPVVTRVEASVIEVAVAVEPAPAPVPAPAPAPAPIVAPTQAAAFDHNAFGDLTGYEEDDIDYVAGKKGVDAAIIRRARKLQLLDKSEA
ncbi:MAG: hypothetical protein I8H93_08080 [Pseudomonadales bacterium]|nr:hypothetical protein [Pseudomonadales bacterium]MBH2075955.1 hypothetical protein [Pseudomonadales bacterium]